MEKIVILFFLSLISFFTWYMLDKLDEEVQEEKQVDGALGYLILLPVSFFFSNYVIWYGLNNYFAPLLGVNGLTYWQVCVARAILNLVAN